MMTLKVGDRVGEYKLAKILPDRIMMEAAEDLLRSSFTIRICQRKELYTKTESKPADDNKHLPGSTYTQHRLLCQEQQRHPNRQSLLRRG